MGFLSVFKAGAHAPAPLPSGCFTVDCTGEIITSTVSSAVPTLKLREISTLVLQTFAEAEALDQSFAELVLDFGAIRITARALAGGAIIFLSPRAARGKRIELLS